MLGALAIMLVLGQSDPSDWAPLPSRPPPEEPAPAAPALPPEGEVVPVAPAPKPEVAKPTEVPAVDVLSPEPRRFTWGHLGLALMGALGDTGYFAVRVEGGAVYGWPRRIAGTLNRAMGPTIAVAADLLAAKIRVRTCGSAGVCGSRYQGGLALRAAWSWGVIGNDGIVAPIHSVFLQAVGFMSSNSIASAPLAPGNVWGEHGVRFDLGATSGILRGALWPSPGSFVIGGGLYVALSLEWLIINTDETGRFRAGISLGVGI